MRRSIMRSMPYEPLEPWHPDYSAVAPIVCAITRSAGGLGELEVQLPLLFRAAIDEVIDAPRTGRYLLSETEKTEKTYLGTKVEILIRSYLGFPKGSILDLDVNGTEIDIKNTMKDNWSIPRENVGRPALLIRTNEETARCDVGVAILHEVYLRPGTNQDKKRGLSAAAFSNVWWILRRHRYPINFWQLMTMQERADLMAAGGGTKRVAALFEKVQRVPISRVQIQALAQQHDYMKRIRRNGGARDLLSSKGIAILRGAKDRDLIARLRLGLVTREEFISYRPTDPIEIEFLRRERHIT
jgi:hypothetical protein